MIGIKRQAWVFNIILDIISFLAKTCGKSSISTILDFAKISD
jgi:hypothetical protein